MATPCLPLVCFVALFYLLSFNPLVAAVSPPKVNNLARRAITVDLPRNPNYTPNGPAAYARALSKWGGKVPKELVKSLTNIRADSKTTDDVHCRLGRCCEVLTGHQLAMSVLKLSRTTGNF
jgi:hypothetical protein